MALSNRELRKRLRDALADQKGELTLRLAANLPIVDEKQKKLLRTALADRAGRVTAKLTKAIDAGETVERQLIAFSNQPDAGSYKLSYGEETTDAIAWDDVAADVQTALRALTGLESVTVTQDDLGFVVKFFGVDGDVDMLTVSDNTLEIAEVEAVTEEQLITFSNVPDAGSFKLSYGEETTVAIAFDDVAADVQTALRAIEGLEDVTVAGDYTAGFTVTFTGVDGDVDLLVPTDNTLEASTEPVLMNVDETVKGVEFAAAEPTDVTVSEQEAGSLVALLTPERKLVRDALADQDGELTAALASGADFSS